MGTLGHNITWAHAAAAAIALLFVWELLRRRVSRLRTWHRFEKAARAEKAAINVAEKHGFRVEGAQVALQIEVDVNGKRSKKPLRADLLLGKGRERFLGEVKTGKEAPDPLNTKTRRQLLEYAVASGVDEIQLINMETKKIHSVRFPALRTKTRPSRLILAFALGLLIEFIVHPLEHLLSGAPLR